MDTDAGNGVLDGSPAADQARAVQAARLHLQHTSNTAFARELVAAAEAQATSAAARVSLAHPRPAAVSRPTDGAMVQPCLVAATPLHPLTRAMAPHEPVLYQPTKMRRPEFWQFVRLVAPDPRPVALARKYSNRDAKEAFCLKCKQTMPYDTSSSNNVSRHMLKFHPEDVERFRSSMDARRKLAKKLKTTSTAASASCASLTSVNVAKNDFQTMIPVRSDSYGIDALIASTGIDDVADENVDRNQQHDASSGAVGAKREWSTMAAHPEKTQSYFSELVARWVSKRRHSLQIVNEPELQEIIRVVSARGPQARSSLPSVASLEASIVSLSARTQQSSLQNLAEALYFSVSAHDDGGDDRAASVVYRVHYVTEDFEARYHTFDVRSRCSLTRLDLSARLTRSNLDPRWWTTFISAPRDSSIEIPKFVTKIPCAVQTIQDILQSCLCRSHDHQESHAPNKKEFLDVVHDCLEFSRQLVRNIQSHGEISAVAPTNKLRIMMDSPHDWISSLQMLRQLSSNKAEVVDLLLAAKTSQKSDRDGVGVNDEELPTPDQWQTMERLVALLRPFENVIEAVRRDENPTLSFTLALVRVLLRELTKDESNTADTVTDTKQQRSDTAEPVPRANRFWLEETRKWLCNELQNRFSPVMDRLLWVSLLDPRLRTTQYLAEDEINRCRIDLTNHAIELNRQLFKSLGQPKTAPTLMASDAPDTSDGVISSSLLNLGQQPYREDSDTSLFLRQLLFEDDAPLVPSQQQLRPTSPSPQLPPSHAVPDEFLTTRIKAEVADYMDRLQARQQPNTRRYRSPLAWWHAHSRLFPLLSPLARQWLSCIGATRAPSSSLPIDLELRKAMAIIADGT